MMMTENKTLSVPENSIHQDLREVRNNILFELEKKNYKTLLLSATTENENQTQMSLDLARSISLAEKKVLLVDTDLENQQLSLLLESTDEAGLTEAILNDDSSDKLIMHTTSDGLDFLPAGAKVDDSAKLLQGHRLLPALGSVIQAYDYVICDGPAMNGDSSIPFFADSVDAVLFVLRQRVTSQTRSLAAIKKLKAFGANVIGSVYTIG
ncbi:CpsD/CapB family tyrosine-protein kinase [Lacticaseibacillus suibinensis]|uniref:CpsD/CapB family tyrosine-protein kinase n=1 Tax=Lacticaseibacillus suibinensis TaxID=2486011 RepID=UPI000F779977|nr:CpsD/CapB family tyrosine-protein kinase [Lacticaseibacillus suibinensis]